MRHFKHSALATDGLMKNRWHLALQKCFVLSKKYQRGGAALSTYMVPKFVLLKQPIHLHLEDTMTDD